MKNFNLNLDKQTVVHLSSNELNSIQGGGRKRSNRRQGDCKYSRSHKGTTEYCTAREKTTSSSSSTS